MKEVKCSFCERRMRDDEQFGKGLNDWDRPGVICPVCWSALKWK